MHLLFNNPFLKRMNAEKRESVEELKYLLGNMGLEILLAIERGAKNMETIKLFSGIPIACIKGRIPVLMDLDLIRKELGGYFLTRKGRTFKEKLENNNKRKEWIYISDWGDRVIATEQSSSLCHEIIININLSLTKYYLSLLNFWLLNSFLKYFRS